MIRRSARNWNPKEDKRILRRMSKRGRRISRTKEERWKA